MATTLSALVLRGRRYYTAHIGDSRIYRLQRRRAAAADRRSHLGASGTQERAVARHRPRSARADRFCRWRTGRRAIASCWSSDGVWGVLPDALMAEVLLDHPEPQAAAAALTSLALAHGGHDNATAVVIDVLALPDAEPARQSGKRRQPAAAAAPQSRPASSTGCWSRKCCTMSRETLLYRVRNPRSGQQLVLKTLQPAMDGDSDATPRLLMEEWRARRVVSPFFPQVVPAEQRSCLYYLMTWHDGATLQARLDAGQHFPAGEVVRLGVALLKAHCRAAPARHRASRHQDRQHSPRRRTACCASSTSASRSAWPSARPTTRSARPARRRYMAPELFEGAPADDRHDLYAAGVTLYHLLTRKYPYGEIEPFQHPKFGEPVPPDALAAGNSRLAGEHPAQGGGARRRRSASRPPRNSCSRSERGASRPDRGARPAAAGAAQSAHAVENGRRGLVGAQFRVAADPVALKCAA